MWSVGLDAHQRLYVFCVLDENGKPVKQRKVYGGWRKLIEELKSLEEPFTICFEASCGAGHLYDQLRRVARRVVVAHPGQLRLIFKSKRKNDRVDAQKLAMLLMLNQLPEVHVPAVEVRSWRRFIEFRQLEVNKRTRVKNGTRTLLRSHGITAPRGLWSLKGLTWLRTVDLPTATATIERDMLMEELEHLTTQIKRVTGELDRIGVDHPAVMVLRTIPGVGPRTAEAVAAYIDDPRRFSRNKFIGSYFGLVPCQDESAGRARFGHITREGPATVRRLLTEATWQAIRRSGIIGAYHQRVARGDPQRKKIALVATAHYLARVMLAMLTTGEAWREEGDVRAA